MIRLLLLLLLATPAASETVVLGLSQDEVAITTTFDGSELLVFGAVKREAPVPGGAPLQVVITVAGPSEPLIVRRKDRTLGIWINREAMRIDRAPSFYAIATSAPLRASFSHTEDLRHQITLPQAVRDVGEREGVTDPDAFRDALLRIREDAGLYSLAEGAVRVDEGTLFRSDFDLPAQLTEGAYEIRVFLTRDGRVIDWYSGQIDVRKVGFERFLYMLAQDNPLIYGVMSLVIAVAAGWGASAAFRALG